MSEARTRLSELLRRVRAGESALILTLGRPVARLCPVSPADARAPDRFAGRDGRGLPRRGAEVSAARLAGRRRSVPERARLLSALLAEGEAGR